MNATSMVSLDATGAAGKARGSSAGAEAAGPSEDPSFAGLMGASAPNAPPEPAPRGTAARETAAAPSTGATEPGDEDASDREPTCDTEQEACAAQVMALLGLSPPPAASQAVAAGAAGALATQGSHASGSDPRVTVPADGAEALESVLPDARPGLDARGELRHGFMASGAVPLDTSSPLLLASAATGIETRTLDATLPLPAADPATGVLTDAQRTRAATPLAATPSTAAGAPLQHSVGTPAWNDELGTRLAMMVDRGEQLATLQLTPEELGPVEVRLSLREGEATVWFSAQAGETRAALEQALPRLRELFAAGGLALAHAAVNSHTPRDPQRERAAVSLAHEGRETGQGGDEPVAPAVSLRRGLLDLYA